MGSIQRVPSDNEVSRSYYPICTKPAMRGCMIAALDRFFLMVFSPRFDSPNDTSASSRLGRYGKAAGFGTLPGGFAAM